MKDAILPNDGPINLFPPIRGLCDSVGAHRRRYLFRRRHGWWPTETGFHGENWKDWEKCRGIFLRRENSNRIEINWYFYVKYLIFLFTLYFQIWIWEGGPKRPARNEMEKVEGEARRCRFFGVYGSGSRWKALMFRARAIGGFDAHALPRGSNLDLRSTCPEFHGTGVQDGITFQFSSRFFRVILTSHKLFFNIYKEKKNYILEYFVGPFS